MSKNELISRGVLQSGYVVTDITGSVITGGQTVDVLGALESDHSIGLPTTPILEVALQPEGCQSRWPCRLFGVEIAQEAQSTVLASGRLAVNQVTVIEERESWAVLGPQADELFDMMKRLFNLSTDDQATLSRLFSLEAGLDLQSMTDSVIALAEQKGRYNSQAVIDLALTGSTEDREISTWAIPSIRAITVAVAHRDLLQAADLGATYYDPLYERWFAFAG